MVVALSAHLYCISIYSRDAPSACEVAADVLHHPNNVLQLTEVPLYFLLALSHDAHLSNCETVEDCLSQKCTDTEDIESVCQRKQFSAFKVTKITSQKESP